MTADEVLAEIIRARPGPDDVVYVERRGDEFACSVTGPGQGLALPADGPIPDAWIFRSGRWPLDDADELHELWVDLLAELDAMTTGVDRCRWDLDTPWPHLH